MKIFVITKKMLIIAAAVIFVVAAAVIIALSFSDGAVSPTSAMAQLEEYELEYLPVSTRASMPSEASF